MTPQNSILSHYFHGKGSNWNHDISGMDRLCASTGMPGTVPFGTANRFQMGLFSNSVLIGALVVETG